MFFRAKKRIFLDHASITPVAREVSKEMKKYENLDFANPSALYAEALSAKGVLDDSRASVARFIDARPQEIVFTAGGTEANNLALRGVFEKFKTEDFVPHIVVTEIEHPAILEVCNEIERRGGEITRIKVNEKGLVSAKDIALALKENTVLVSVMFANNEIGTIQPIKEIGRVIKEYKLKTKRTNLYFHTDACQAALYIPISVLKLGVDMLTLDSIKMYGPRGVGVLFVKVGTEISPIMHGGGQEKGLRSGTENLPGIAGFAKAVELAEKTREEESRRLTILRDYAISRILEEFKGAHLNGSREDRLPNNINICFPGLDAEFAVISLDISGISVSYSSSCRNLKEDSSSYVVLALGKKECKESSLRFTLGRENKQKDIDRLIVNLRKIVR